MNDEQQLSTNRKVLENSLAFFGAITASISHELNNVMSIIDQNIGLLEDILSAGADVRTINEERLQKIVVSIGKQKERGVGIIKGLNTFAHSVDDPVSKFDLGQLVNNFVKLTQRLASLKKANIESRTPDSPLLITNSSFLLQQILFICFQRALNRSMPGDVITITTSSEFSKVAIEVSGRSGQISGEERWNESYLDQLVRLIGGEVHIVSEGEKELTRILFMVVN